MIDEKPKKKITFQKTQKGIRKKEGGYRLQQ
jgi:hypothetical protein